MKLGPRQLGVGRAADRAIRPHRRAVGRPGLDRQERPLPEPPERLLQHVPLRRIGHLRDQVDVGAGDEHPGLLGNEHEAADVVATGELADQLPELEEGLAREDVDLLLRRVESEGRQVIGADLEMKGPTHAPLAGRSSAASRE